MHPIIKRPYTRGASLLSYGLVVGLISVVALVTVTSVGSSVKTLFVEVGDTVGSAGEEQAQGAGAGSGSNPNAACSASTWSLTSAGSTTYTVPSGCFQIEVTVIGGGGAGGGWSSGTGNSGAGSSFGSSTVVAGGGQGGFTDNGGSGLGGTGGTGTYAGGMGGEGASSGESITHPEIVGGDGATGGGGGGTTSTFSTTISTWAGGTADQPYGGSGAAGYDYWDTGTGATATGCGGGGGADHRSGGGGGGGYSVDTLSVTPGQSFSVTVGAGGSGYTAEHGNYFGGAGADGCVYVDYP